ncbi:MAG: hypothetical protein ACSHYC_25240, partial [Alphaproteobacteria bacterium]
GPFLPFVPSAAKGCREPANTFAATCTKVRFPSGIFFLTFFFQLSIGAFLIRRVGEEAKKPFSNTEERTDL